MMCIISRRRSGRNGVSLIEALLAVAILVSAVGAMLSIRGNAARTSLRARNEKIAIMLAAQVMNEAVLSGGAAFSGRASTDYPEFLCSAQEQPETIGALGTARRLHVTVSWPAAGNDPDARDTLTLETFLEPRNKP